MSTNPAIVDLVRRLAVLESTAGSVSCPRDWRVIEMQLSRAEDKVMRLAKAANVPLPDRLD